MKRVELEKTNLTVPDLAQMASEEMVILTRNGKPLASVKSLSGVDWESLSLADNPRFIALIEESRRSYREQGGIGIDDLRQELGLSAKKHARAPRRGKKIRDGKGAGNGK